MNPPMFNKICHLTETFPTVMTLIWLFLRVTLFMDSKSGLLFEGLPAYIAIKGIL